MSDTADTVIKVDGLSKQYRLGEVGTGSLAADLHRWWARVRGAPDPTLAVSEVNVRDHRGRSEYVWALREVSFEVRRGDVLGIIGRNGAGKSTLLKILSRITAPTCGEVRLRGRVGSLLEVGTGFHAELTGRDNVFLNGAILGMTRAEIAARLDEIVAFSGCERFIDTPVKRYSSGMLVRLGFAVAAHLEPEILIVDEVLAVGDAEFQQKCLGKMQDVAGEGRTVLFVSHNMASVQSLCRSCLLIENGALVDQGQPSEIVTRYLELIVEPRSEKGSLSHHIRRVTLERAGGGSLVTVGPNDEISLRVELDPAGRVFSHWGLGLGVDDARGRRVFTLTSHTAGASLPRLDGPRRVCVRLQLPGLAPGRYAVRAVLSDGGRDVDTVDKALMLEVRASDFFGTGKLPNAAQGCVLVRSFWEEAGG